MITKKILAAIIFIIVGIAIVFIYRGCGTAPKKPDIIPVKVQQSVVHAAQDNYQKKYDSTKLLLNKKEVELMLANNERYRLTNNAKIMEGIINDLQNVPDKPQTTNYDHAVNDYISNAKEKDSSCNYIIENLNSQLDYKDSMIVLKDSLNAMMRISFNTAIIQQTALSEYSRQLKRQLLIKKTGNFIWKTAAVVAGLFILKNSL